MSNPLDKLEIIDDNDNIIGIETRGKVHEEGLLHREIHIWFITPMGEIIFQHRSKNKDTYPDKLDATVGGHVEPNDSYEKTAIKECKEETGLDIDPNKLLFLTKIKVRETMGLNGLINNTIRSEYAYLYDGTIENLQIEKDKGMGFELRQIDDFSSYSQEEKNKFIPFFMSPQMLELFTKAKKILIN